MNHSLKVGIIALLLLMGCDNADSLSCGDTASECGEEPNNSIDTPISGKKLATFDEFTFSNQILNISMDSIGWHREARLADDYAVTAASLSLWLYAETDQPRIAMENASGPTRPGYRLHSQNPDLDPGIFVLTKDSLSETIANWPSELGAPTLGQNQPRVYGDYMMWGNFIPSAGEGGIGTPPLLNDLSFGKSVYMFEGESVLLMRYDITNNGSTAIQDLTAGFFSDFDLIFPSSDVFETCERKVSYNSNATGYDPLRALTYTYIQATEGAVDVAPECFGYTSGHMFIDAPTDPSSPLAHTIVRRRSDSLPEGFIEGEFHEAIHFGRILNGLSKDGDPMIDPTTNQSSRFAFTGDPVAGTGWLDTPQDVRGMLSLQPFSVAPGETQSITIAIILVRNQPDLESALEELRNEADRVRENRTRYLE